MRPLVLITFVLSFLYVLICADCHVHVFIHTRRNACSALLLSRSGKMELQQACLNNLSTNLHAETAAESTLCPPLPARARSVPQVQCIRLMTSAHWWHTGSATHLAIALPWHICMRTVDTAPHACRTSFVLLICSQNLSAFTQIQLYDMPDVSWTILTQDSFSKQHWST